MTKSKLLVDIFVGMNFFTTYMGYAQGVYYVQPSGGLMMYVVMLYPDRLERLGMYVVNTLQVP